MGNTTLENLLAKVPADSPTPSQKVMLGERDQALREAADQLPEPARQVVQWRNYERCPFEEIGSRLGRSAEAARKIWSRALEQLSELLELQSHLVRNSLGLSGTTSRQAGYP